MMDAFEKSQMLSVLHLRRLGCLMCTCKKGLFQLLSNKKVKNIIKSKKKIRRNRYSSLHFFEKCLPLSHEKIYIEMKKCNFFDFHKHFDALNY